MLETQFQEKKNDNPILRDSLKNQMVLQSFKMILTEALCVFLHLRKKPIRRQFFETVYRLTLMMIYQWTSLFGLNLGRHLSTCPSFRPFGLRKPQKVAKEVSTYFSLNLTRLRL